MLFWICAYIIFTFFLGLLVFKADKNNGLLLKLFMTIFGVFIVPFFSCVAICRKVKEKYLSIKNPYNKLKKELDDLNISFHSLIFLNDDFIEKYLPDDLKPRIVEGLDGSSNYVLPLLDTQERYSAFKSAVCRFWDDHSLIHQTRKGFYFLHKSETDDF